jgi:hypothetical protein
MKSDRQRRIEQRAYEIWEREGRPHGKHDEHWHRAAQEIGGGRTAGRAAGSGTKSAGSNSASVSKPRAKTSASASNSGGAVSRTAKPAPATKSGAASTRGRRKQPTGTQS